MNFNAEAAILYEYIVGGVPTTDGNLVYTVSSKYGMYVGEETAYEPVFVKYGVNYLDRARGKRGGRGQHLGKYRKGYKNTRGQLCPVTQQVIIDYMNAHLRTGINLEDYLADRFNVTQAPPQRTYTPPQQTYVPPQEDDYVPSYSPRSYSAPDFGGLFQKLGSIAVTIVVFILAYNFVLKPIGDKLFGSFGSNKNSSSGYSDNAGMDNSTLLSDEQHMLEIYVEFEGKKSQMFLKKDYILCIGNDLQGELEIGYNNGFNATITEGYHDFWVQSGDKKSDVYEVLIQNDGSITFKCEVGIFGPKFEWVSGSGVTVEEK